MTMPNDRQINWLAQTMAARMLVDAAAAPRAEQLDQALRFWFPTGDLDAQEIAEIRTKVQGYWRGAAAALDARREQYIATRRAEPLPGSDGRI